MRGTQAFTDAMDEYHRGINDQKLAITAQGLKEQQGLYGMASNRRSQAMQEMLQARNQPINEISALMGGGQVHLPGAQAYQGGNIAAADVAGNVYNTAALQQKQYEQQMAQHNQNLAGMYGLGQAAIGGGARILGRREAMTDYFPSRTAAEIRISRRCSRRAPTRRRSARIRKACRVWRLRCSPASNAARWIARSAKHAKGAPLLPPTPNPHGDSRNRRSRGPAAAAHDAFVGPPQSKHQYWLRLSTVRAMAPIAPRLRMPSEGCVRWPSYNPLQGIAERPGRTSHGVDVSFGRPTPLH